ncbi:LOW QUALITY PROTEIN: sialoadhesin-like [Anabas testudineus]|uniref:LOW QUALITY PROTEIN: sialoadhesin-like n=1 Tax=Anabas testudineus TaxID=64144 RepID=UPI00143CEB39|nr:LOW QUALITY PROTEIN: sialoadhesin-like [Anabas testudineus]
MSLTTSAFGFIVFLLSTPVVQGQNDWGVTYTSTQICAVEGSTVDIHSYTYPSRQDDLDIIVEKTLWFINMLDNEPVDLRTDSKYSGRVKHLCDKNSCFLRITDLRQRDSAVYRFRFITNHPGGRFTGSPGVTLTVTDLKVKVIQTSYSSYWTTLRCKSSCHLPGQTSIIWYKNNKKIKENTELHYSDYIYSQDSFSCAIKGLEDFPSPPVCVRGENCNRVIYTERSICVSKGSSVNISCTYNSYHEVTSKFWFRPEPQWKNPSQSEDLLTDSQYTGRVQVLETERGRSTLRITDLRETDSAQYQFTFTTWSFEWGSSLPGTTLTVTALQVHVIRLTVHQSYTEAELQCHSSCSSVAQSFYVWFKNGQKVMKEEALYKDNFYPGDVICCVLKGHENHCSPSVSALKVPSVSVSPQSEIMEGSSVTLTCNSEAQSAVNYTWYKKNQTLLNKEPQLVFSSIQSSDSGQFYCSAENELGKKTSPYININVKHRPNLPSVSVSPSEIVEGSSVTLTCSSDANPAANYTWYKGNQTIHHGPEGIYRFTSIRSKDKGTYYCKSENQYGDKSSSISVDVHYRPNLPSVSVSPSEIVEGSSVTLTCSSDANPAANYTWYKENEESPKASGQIFTITDIRSEHSGNYYCEVQNSVGRHNNTLHLTVVAVFPQALKSAVIGTSSVVFFAILAFLIFLLIRKKKASKPAEPPEPSEQHIPTQSEEEDDVQYASVRFIKNQTDPIYSNISAARAQRHKDEDEDESVEYAAVQFNSTASRTTGQEAVEDSIALYSTINKLC